MKLFDLLIRFAVAWGVGCFFCAIAAMMTTYDGFPSLVLLPIVVAVMTGIAVVVVLLVGLPLMFAKVWTWWSRNYLVSIALVAGGIVLMILSWSPFRIETYDYTTARAVETFHPVMSLSGWFALIFGLLYCPLLSIRPWADRWNRWIEAARKEKN